MSPVFRRPSRKLVLTSLLLIGVGLALVGEITARGLGF